MVAGVLLTGGQSRRLGVDKARVAFAGETFATHAAAVLASVCDPCIEVGSGASPLRCIRESPEGEGPLVAFMCGVRALHLEPDTSVVLLACDMPRVSRDLLQWLAVRPAATVIPIARGRPQYGCAKYGGAVLDAMARASDAGTRSFKWLHEADQHEGEQHDGVEWVDETVWGVVADPTEFRDVDTPADARELGIDVG